MDPLMTREPADRPAWTLRRTWQVPAFLAGVLAVLAVWLARPLCPQHRASPLDRDFAAVRRALDQPRVDARQRVALAERLLQQAEPFPDHAGEAHFLLGSAYLRLAERSTDPGDAWVQARSHLGQAEALGVPEADRPRLAYRLGK